ncbi:unnamed protein product [Closterium sp. Naga37s-1]|nr:unnamed protein product [Closterium sp. Naga37s-1]
MALLLPATCGAHIVAGLPPLYRPTRTSSHRASPPHFNVSSAGRVLSHGRNLSPYQLASLVPLPLIAHAAAASAKLQRNAALTSCAVACQSEPSEDVPSSSQANASQNRPASFTIKAASAAVAAAVAAATSAISAFTAPAALAVDSDALSRYEQIAGKAVQRSVVTITSAAATGPVNITSAGEAAGAAAAGEAASSAAGAVTDAASAAASSAPEAVSAVTAAVSDAVAAAASAAAPAAVTEAASAAASTATSAATSAVAGVADLFTSAVPAAASAAAFDAEVALTFAAAAGATALLAGAFSFLTRKQYAGDLTPEAALEKALEEPGEEWEEEGEAVVLLDIRDGKEKSRSGNPTLKSSPKRLVAVAYREDSVKRKAEEGEGDGEDDVVIELGDRKEGFLDAVKEAKALVSPYKSFPLSPLPEPAPVPRSIFSIAVPRTKAPCASSAQLVSPSTLPPFPSSPLSNFPLSPRCLSPLFTLLPPFPTLVQEGGLPWKKPFLRLPSPALPSLPSLPSFNLGINLEESVSTVKEVFTTVESGASTAASAAASAAPAALGILAAAGLSVAVLAEVRIRGGHGLVWSIGMRVVGSGGEGSAAQCSTGHPCCCRSLCGSAGRGARSLVLVMSWPSFVRGEGQEGGEEGKWGEEMAEWYGHAEALLTLVASVALLQFIATKLLFAKVRGFARGYRLRLGDGRYAISCIALADVPRWVDG